MTAPAVAGIDGNGLLTMEKVLALKLNADWVILSACNSCAGAAAGAEAATGLGQAFFYARARALLLTNLAVYSDAAAKLVTDISRRQAADSH
jgi:CHAT domain-containing protein